MTRIQQGAFSLSPDLTDEQIKAQLQYCKNNGLAIGIEYTDDPHPRNCYWEMWGLPLFDMPDVSAIMYEINEARKAYPNQYIKINAFNNARGVESTGLSFIVQRPSFEPGFYLSRQEGKGRNIIYTMQSYAVQSAGEGARY
jgi:ribulose-bisphosphate carboxylase small chain|uniref:Multifunctional fusion protein n=1 Tax=Ochromonas sp. CCMP1393 TaxID=420556 RepID=A0A0D3MK58_9STRA|nr:ribulose-1,5-bisphosphate carboxylase/oxygenase small subunit [Ochromonas sp. CCMP1393]